MRTLPPIAGAGILLACGIAAYGADPALVLLPKQVAAPPSDIIDGTVRLPAPDATPTESTYARIPVVLQRGASGVLEWTGQIPVDDGANVRMMLMQPDRAGLTWEATPPGGTPSGKGAGPAIERAEIDELAESPGAEIRTFTLEPRGLWTVRVHAPGAGVGADGRADAWLFVASDSAHALRSSVDLLNHVPGGAATIVADLRTDARWPEAATLTEVVVHIDDRTIEMLDDGAHGDAGAGDGTYGVRIPLDRVGVVSARVEASGITQRGERFVRTIDHRIEVAPGGIALAPAGTTGAMSADAGGDQSQVRIDVPAAFDDPARRVLVAAEVWGVSPATGERIPAVWAAMITEPHRLADGSLALSLYVDRRWLATNGVVGPYELRNLRVHDLDTFVPVAMRDVLPVAVHGDLRLPRALPRAVDTRMLIGRARADLALAMTLPEDELSDALSAGRAFGAHNLLLSHGYCADGSPWPPGDFTGYLEAFSDPNQNRTHDQFAQLLLAFGNNSKSYGIVAHSQGGCGALHLWTFYFSGLDWATGPRLIQSLGTPYQGTPLASLGGFSCGVNNDMTPAGSATWLSTIPSAQRDAVYYWTTSFTSSWCNFFANFVLSSPNDGVVEVSRGQLPGGHNMGNKIGWCHTTGMSYPAGYTDATRNSDLNANGAR